MHTQYHRLVSLALLVLWLAACSNRAAVPAAPTPGADPQASSTPEKAVSPTPAPTPTATPLPYPTVGGLGAVIIYQPELEREQRQLESALQVLGLDLAPEQQRARALANLVDQEILAQAAFEKGFHISDSDLKAAYQSQGGIEAWWAQNAFDRETFLIAARRSMAAAWMREQIFASIPEAVEQVRARQIVTATLPEAQQVLEQARQPGDQPLAARFAALAYRWDPYSGGDLGWFSRGTLFFPQVEAALLALPGGEPALTEVIETPLGFHVALRIARETRPLAREARLSLQRQALSEWLAARRAALHVQAPALDAFPALLPATDAIPRYAVQEGDLYYAIAQRLRAPVQALIDANPDFPPEALSTGSELLIPGVKGTEGRVAALPGLSGASPLAVARAYGMAPDLLARLNRLTSADQLYENSALLAPESIAQRLLDHPLVLVGQAASGSDALVSAIQHGESPWLLALASGLSAPGRILPGDALFLPARENRLPMTLPVDTARLQLVQGATLTLRVDLPTLETPPAGRLDGFPLHFFRVSGGWVALQGLPAMGETGLARLELQVQGLGEFEVSLPFYPGDFPQDPPLAVDPATIDPAVTQPEENRIREITAPATPDQLWEGMFRPPVDSPGCFRSLFGNRRSFNDSPYAYFHSGLDYGVCGSPDIFAPARGKVVFAGALDVRGSATILDHGWGVYSGYWHQSEILVKPGDAVQAGQVIGKIGATGRITGEHLHWEIWAGGVQVDPLQWLEKIYPETP